MMEKLNTCETKNDNSDDNVAIRYWIEIATI